MVRPISRGEALELLGLPATASPADITGAFRRLAKLSHPDATGRTDAAAGRRFAALADAYRLLVAPAERTRPTGPTEPSHPARPAPSSSWPGSRPPIVAGPVVITPYPPERGR